MEMELLKKHSPKNARNGTEVPNISHMSWHPPYSTPVMGDWETGCSRGAGSAEASGSWLHGIPLHLISWATSQIRSVTIYLTMAFSLWTARSAGTCAKVHNAKMASSPSTFCLSVWSYWQLLMKVIFHLINANELWHYITKCDCKNPTSAASCVTACSGSSLPCLSCSHILFGYELLPLQPHGQIPISV